MSSTVEEERGDMTLAETAPVIEGCGVPDDVAKEAGVEAMNSQAQAIDARELKAILGAILFVSPEPVPGRSAHVYLGDGLKSRSGSGAGNPYARLGSGRARYSDCAGRRRVSAGDEAEVRALAKTDGSGQAAQKLSRSALESLAIIAYKQPLVQSVEIEEIRGVETSGVLRTLCERKLVRIVGRKDVPGRPIMYGTTKFFL